LKRPRNIKRYYFFASATAAARMLCPPINNQFACLLLWTRKLLPLTKRAWHTAAVVTVEKPLFPRFHYVLPRIWEKKWPNCSNLSTFIPHIVPYVNVYCHKYLFLQSRWLSVLGALFSLRARLVSCYDSDWSDFSSAISMKRFFSY